MAVDTPGHLLAQHVTSASRDDRAEVGRLAAAIQDTTDERVELVYVDQAYAGEKPAGATRAHGIALEVIKLPEAKRGFVLLPRRWVVERSSYGPRDAAGASRITSVTLQHSQVSMSYQRM